MKDDEMKVRGLLERPYSRVVIPDPESGTFTARVAEFPGCVAQGDSVADAYENLQRAAEDWVRVALDMGQGIPKPYEDQTYSGRVLVRFPASIHRRAAEMAARENTSLNQMIVSAVSEAVGAASVGSKWLDLMEQAVDSAVAAESVSYKDLFDGDVEP